MNEEDQVAVGMFMSLLAIDMKTAIALVREGHTTIEEIACVPEEELLCIPGMDRTRMAAFRMKARTHLLGETPDEEQS